MIEPRHPNEPSLKELNAHLLHESDATRPVYEEKKVKALMAQIKRAIARGEKVE